MQPRRPSCVAHTSHARWHRQIADVCVVSSIRDGMNLVSHEFVACQDEESPGVLVLRWGEGRVRTQRMGTNSHAVLAGLPLQ